MAKSLQEQLLQSGAARPKQAKKARREKAANQKAARQGGGVTAEEQALRQQVAAAETEKRDRDRALNEKRNAERAAREREDEAAQLIAGHTVAPESNAKDSAAYNYRLGKQIRSVYVSAAQRRELAAGRLAVVCHRDKTALVARLIAERLEDKIPDRVWLMRPATTDEATDDAYAEFPVPDDLMW